MAADNKWRPERIVVALFIVAVVVRGLSTYYAYLNYKTGDNSATTGRHVRRILDDLYKLQFEASQVANVSGKYLLTHQDYYARLMPMHVANLSTYIKDILDSTKDEPTEYKKMSELGILVSDMEKNLPEALLPARPDERRRLAGNDIAASDSLADMIIAQTGKIIPQELQNLDRWRLTSIAYRKKLFDQNYYAAIVGTLFVLIVLLALNRDIRRRKIAEFKTRENEQKLRKMIEDVGDVIYSSDYMGNFTFINTRLRSLTGYSHDELIGKHYSFLVHPAWMQKVADFYMHQFKDRINETRLEFPIVTKKGKMKWVEQNVVLLQRGGKVEGFQCVVRDITGRKEAEENMRAALEKEKQINELKSRFVSLASHEFRTPLGTILSSTELIREYIEYQGANPALIKDKEIHHLNRIKAAIHNMVSTLNNFLSLDQLEHGKTATNPTEFDITELSGKIMDSLSEKLKPGQKISYIHSSKMKTVFMDKNILDNVILNLLTNAIKYSFENSAIIYTTNVKANGLEFTVEDHGIGIPESEQGTLFERFFRAKNTLNIEGTGLGLSIVKRYIDLLNGHISFTSSENEGSTFKVFIANAPRETTSATENKLIKQV